MLALQDSAVEAARTARELLANIQSRMAAQQGGEAFMDMPEIPAFLRRKRGDPPDTTPMPEWILKKQAERPQNTFKRIEDMPDPDDGASDIELRARMLKRGAAAELKAKDQATAEAKEAKARDKRNKRLGLPEGASASEPLPAGYWDATANKWRPEGYMSLSRYRRLLLGMPGPAYRAAFIKAYGHTQEERHRNPDDKTMRLLRHTMGLAEVRELPATGDAGPSAPAKPPTAKAAPAAPRKVTVLEKLAKATAPAKPKAKAKDSIAQSKSVGPEGNRVSTENESKMLALLDRPQGCTLEELGAPFKWLPHSAGARLSALKKHHTIVKAKEARGTVYRRATEESK